MGRPSSSHEKGPPRGKGPREEMVTVTNLTRVMLWSVEISSMPSTPLVPLSSRHWCYFWKKGAWIS